MKRKWILILEAIFLIVGMTGFQACFYSQSPAYGPPYYEPGGGTVILGDYDENHVWHDRYWWVSNRHDWVHEHHPDWVEHETHEEHQAYSHHHDHDAH
jgi:hypothetical protein